ncbi:hypothetical protein [Acaryochloris thomasi]|uniref:hypothetical protein n=1 Tax=Acaryochloris thomasi TaxID=2929456 RepID=UPI0018F22D82|nr:hypothetical protein [Acaryochloris thomasi]
MPPYTPTLDTTNLAETHLSKEAVKHWISELTDFTPQQIDRVVAERYQDTRS